MTNDTGFYQTNISTLFVDTMLKYKGFSFMGEYALRNAADALAKNSDNSIEIRRPRHTLNTSTDLNSPFANGKFTIRTTTVVGNWDNYTDGSGAKKLPNYTLLDFSFSKKISEDINFVAEINNLFDRNHKETWGYNVKGRSAVIKLAKSW